MRPLLKLVESETSVIVDETNKNLMMSYADVEHKETKRGCRDLCVVDDSTIAN